MSTNENKYGGRVAGYSHVFVAPTEVFYAPTLPIKVYDEDGNEIGTELVDIQTYYNTVDASVGRTVRTIKHLAGGTHSVGLFNTDENKGEFTSTRDSVEAAGILWGGNDYTLEGNVAYNLVYSEFNDKFWRVSPLNKRPIIEVPDV